MLLDHSETSNKCTIAPLAQREDLTIYPVGRQTRFSAHYLLHPNGVPLNEIAPSVLRSHAAFAAIDCLWRRLDPILQTLARPWPTLVSIPRAFVTAYPRRGKKVPDPDGGLATIEALFIAGAFAGSWDLSLLSRYYFSSEFLRLNRPVFESFGISVPDEAPPFVAPLRTSLERRRARGRRVYV